MTKPAGHSGGRYLYAIARDAGAGAAPPPLAGVGGAPVRIVVHDGIAAVASETGLARIRPERRHLAAHHAVVQHLIQHGETILPVAFGTIATSEAALLKMLKRHQASLAGELKRVAGLAEMGVRIRWDVPNIFQHLLDRREDLKTARDTVSAHGAAASRDDKIELGSLFEHALNEERERYVAYVEKTLSACSRELQRGPPRSETEVVNLACLIPYDAIDRFEKAMAELARRLDENLVLSYSGPWPPQHFVHLNISV